MVALAAAVVNLLATAQAVQVTLEVTHQVKVLLAVMVLKL
jgi:hypothetical protein